MNRRNATIVLAILVGVALAAPASADHTRSGAIARFDQLSWTNGGKGPQGRLNALRAAGYKPTAQQPTIRHAVIGVELRVVETHRVAPPPCPPCPCTDGKRAPRVCAPCVACRPITMVSFTAVWRLDEGAFAKPIRQAGPHAGS